MALPNDLTTVVVTGKYLDPSGQALAGTVTFTPSAELTDATGTVMIPAAPRTYPLSAGRFTTDALVATDNAGLTPANWTYQVTVAIQNLKPRTFSVLIPHAPSPVDISALTPSVSMALAYPYDLAPAATEKVIYVSASARASDQNTGLSPGEPLATIAAAVALVAARGGVVQLGAGTFPIAAADGSGNGVTLPGTAITLRGLGAPTIVSLECPVTWGILCQGPLSQVSDLIFQVAAGGSCTYAIGVDTPASTGTAEKTTFSGVVIENVAGGSVTDGFAVGPSHAGSSTVDITGTIFVNCHATGASSAGFLVGNGTSGNILNTHMYGCEAVSCAYGVRLAACDVTWYGGNLGENTIADLRIEGTNGAPVVLSGFRSEGSARLLSANLTASSATVAIRDATWVSGDSLISPAGDVIADFTCGTLTLDSLSILNLGSVTPVFLVGDSFGQTAIRMDGCAVSAPLATLFSAAATGNVSVTASAFVQLTGAGGFAGSTAGPVRLGPSNVVATHNGTPRASLSPTETITLASSGAVAINGTCEIADITLQANAASSSVANTYLGQRLIIAWRQDGTGGRTYAWPAACKFYGGSPPAPSTAAHAVDAVAFWCDGTSLIQSL